MAAECTDMHDLVILPLPKLNAAQTEYATGIHESVTIFGISQYSNCKNTAAATLELMSYYSAQLVTDTFTTHLLHGVCPHCSTETTGRTQKLVEQNVNVDFVSAWSHNLSDASHLFRDVNNIKSQALHSVPRQLTSLLEQLEKDNE